jgi:penicillin-binding protein 2
MDRNNGQEKIIFISFIVIAAFLLLAMRLWQLQILQGKEYRKISEANRLRIISIPAPRGIIFDRNGLPLVENSPYFSASIVPNEFDKDRVVPLSRILNLPAEEIFDKISKNDLSTLIPVKLKQRLPFNEIAYIEARRSDFPGLIIETEVGREYVYGDVGSHLIGYLGKLTPSQLKDPAFRDIPPDMFVGQWGVEKLFDSSLRGIPGNRIIEVNALGREIRLIQEKPPVTGQDITLSIDIHMQEATEKAFGDRAGASVALSPDSGEILAIVSKPSFDPNLFTGGISHSEWTNLIDDKKNPMLNRAIQSQYPPGSTFKIVTALAGLEEGVISTDTKVDCKGVISYGNWHFGCWQKTGHGLVSLHRAIAESCDVFFYETGRRLGIDRIYDYAIKLGLGKKTGVELGKERAGLIPNSKWKMETKKTAWYRGETLHAAIGQGYVTATPLQMAVMTATVVNGGVRYKPILLKDAPPVVQARLQLSHKNLEIIKNSLLAVVEDPGGTGWAARSGMVDIGGKTGTSQVVSIKKSSRYLPEQFRDHAWFVAFAPFEKPEIALSVLVEHGGHGGGAAAPIAKQAIEAYINSQRNMQAAPPDSLQ